MANPEHLAILNQGVETWNQWRKDNPHTNPNLTSVNLRMSELSDVDLRNVDLRWSNLSRAQLRGANLSNARLNWIELVEANLSDANLYKANLVRAKLIDAKLFKANLVQTNLHGADLSRANLSKANLSKTNIDSAYLYHTNLSGAVLYQANVTEARIGWTVFGNVDMSQVKGLLRVHHNGPSIIGIETIYQSAGRIPEEFLRGASVPDKFIAYVKALVGKPIEYYSAFISHSSKDKDFADRIFADLQSNNVRTWYAPEDLKIGEKFRQRIDESIRLHDKLLLVLSEESVASEWVDFEVEAALEKGANVLFPVRIDDAIMDSDKAWAKHIKRTLHIGRL